MITTGFSTVALHGTGLFADSVVIPALIIGFVASILPDIDSATGKPIEVLTTLLAALAVYIVWSTFLITAEYNSLINFLILACVIVLIKYPIVWVSKKVMVHRGVTHSLLFMITIHNIIVLFMDRYYNTGHKEALFIGLIFLIGYLTHLLLDEVYAVDFSGQRVKRSFGTAMKLFQWESTGDKARTLILVLIIGLTSKHIVNPPIGELRMGRIMAYSTPRSEYNISFYEALHTQPFWARVFDNLWGR
jgi:hypothetical protein